MYQPNITESQAKSLNWIKFTKQSEIPSDKPILVETIDKFNKTVQIHMLLGKMSRDFLKKNKVTRFCDLSIKLKSDKHKPETTHSQLSIF